MTTATQNLENDHVQILRLIGVMERIAGTSDPDVEHLEMIVKVIREFADGLHHAKEEQLLFPLMVQKGFSNQTGPVAVMLHDHEEGRNFVKGIAENILLYKSGETSASQGIFSNTRAMPICSETISGKKTMYYSVWRIKHSPLLNRNRCCLILQKWKTHSKMVIVKRTI